MADWSALLPEILHFISQHLPTSMDLIRFRSVCHTWRAAAPPPPPAVSRYSVGTDTNWDFYLSKNTVYLLQPRLPGQSSWIVKLGWLNPEQKHLFHPVNGHRFLFCEEFPKIIDFSNIRVRELGEEYRLEYINPRSVVNSNEQWYNCKDKIAVLNNGSGGLVILAIHWSGKLIVYKSIDEKWSFVVDDFPYHRYEDIILWGGQFYAVDESGWIVVVNIDDLKVSVVASVISGGYMKVFVGSDRELLLVDMYILKMRVFRVSGEKSIEISDLGDKIVFLCRNCTFSVSSVEIFGDDECSGIYYDGYYDLENGCQRSSDRFIRCSDLFWPPPDLVL